MIVLSNRHTLQYVVASGGLAFDGKGWWYDKPFLWLGLLCPQLFVIFLKTLTFNPIKGNYVWYKPWTCIRHLWRLRGAINKVGLTNPGFMRWYEHIAPRIKKSGLRVVVSLYGTTEELVAMVRLVNTLDFVVAIEINVSCPNTGHAMDDAETVCAMVRSVTAVSRHPVILKLSVDQPYAQIAKTVEKVAAISLNSVPEHLIFPKGWRNPLRRLIARVGGGGGGVSGKPAQDLNWKAVKELAQAVPHIPIIAPSIMEYGDLAKVDALGAKAYSFGAIHLYGPWKPTSIVRRHMAETRARSA